jgi:hypothetical protein
MAKANRLESLTTLKVFGGMQTKDPKQDISKVEYPNPKRFLRKIKGREP